MKKKWLKELADTQVAEKGMDPGKCLQHLQWTKEQCRIAWQIWRTNQTQRQAGGLSQVATAMAEGLMIQHINQNNIKMACLAKAQARFTQVNYTPCMTKPLYTELHWLGTHLPAFEQIAAGTYILPLNTPPSANALFPLLQQPLEIIDHPTTLTQQALLIRQVMLKVNWLNYELCLVIV